jgi:predicted dehydrogenase
LKNSKEKKVKTVLTRRDFLGVTIAGASITVVTSLVLSGPGKIAPSDKLNIACVGIGGKGRVDVEEISGENVVALCDVDQLQSKTLKGRFTQNAYEKFPRAKVYKDFRKMFDEMDKSIDAVTVSTPDHTHAVITLAAIERGIHVFCQKPLTHTIYEARKITLAARKAGIATQMGNQAHAGEGPRILNEMIWAGAIGTVKEVHCFTNRPIWPQGLDRPSDTPPVPETLDWELWLGPMPYRPYHPVYVPFGWRAWWDFGCGALGDMGCHIMDYPKWALDLDYPSSVEAHTTGVNNETGPHGAIVYYKFPAKGNRPEVQLIWYEGGIMPPRPQGFNEDLFGDAHSGVLFVGEKGSILHRHHAARPILIPEQKFKDYQDPPKTMPRSKGHYIEWIDACKGGKPAMSNFDYAAPLTEIVLLGNLSMRTGQKLSWDGPNMISPDVPEANQFIHIPYREGWHL